MTTSTKTKTSKAEKTEKVEKVEAVEIDELQFPKVRLVQFGSLESALQNDLPMHNRNISEIVKAGNYKFKSVNVIPSERNSMVYYTYTIVLERE